MENYELQISIGAISFKIASHDKAWVEKKEQEYLKYLDDENIAKEAKESVRKAGSKDRQESPKIQGIAPNEFYRKFIHENKIKSRPDIVTILVYYLTKVQKKNQITVNDVKGVFKEVHYPGWDKVNWADSLLKAKKKAFLNSVGGEWSLTITGEDYVLNLLSGENEQ